MSTASLKNPASSVFTLPTNIAEEISARADALDRGEGESRAVLTSLAEIKALDLGAPGNTNGELVAMAAVISALSERCMSSAFTTWAHRMTIEYLATADTPYAELLLPRLRSGHTPGITGMASAFRELAGCGSLEITATTVSDGYLLDGPIRWASNLYDDALLVTAVRTDKGEKLTVALPLGTPGIKVGRPFSLLALGSTASSFLSLSGVHIGPENVLTRDFDDYLATLRPTFMVLQTALCVGLARTSIASARDSLTGINSVFTTEVESLTGKLALVNSTMVTTARSVGTDIAPTRAELLALRLAGAELATGAATVEAKTAGGKGYASNSATSRRFREAAFIPVQSPSEAQLRWELSSCEQ